MRRTDTETLIAAMRILSRDIRSGDGVANAAIAEAADRLDELKSAHDVLMAALKRIEAGEEMTAPFEHRLELVSRYQGIARAAISKAIGSENKT